MKRRRCRKTPGISLPPFPAAGTALLLALLSGGQAQAAKWLTVVADGKGKVEIDAASIERGSDGKVRAWHRETYSPRRLQESGAFSYGSLMQQSEFQCEKRQVTALTRVYYADTVASSGNELRSENPAGGEAAPVMPDTPAETLLKRACRPPATAKPGASAKPEAASPPPTEPPAKPAKAKNGKEAPPPPKPPAAWAYEGKLGAARWGKLDAGYTACADGRRQSPIDLRGTIRADLPPLDIAYQPVPLAIIDDGHGIQVRTAGGGTISVDGEEFELQSFRFHRPGEEMVGGKRAAMSVQFEHRAKSGRLAILAVPLQEGRQEHKLVRALWSALPLEAGKMLSPAGVMIDPGQLLPEKREYYTYSGSQTTPPCSEGVLWLVMKHAVPLSREQVTDFGRIYRNNARPIQPANGRVIKESR